MVSSQVIKYAALFYSLVKFADLKGSLATRVMLSAIPSLIQKGIKKKYGEKGETDPDTILKMQNEIKESVGTLVERLSPAILAGGLELVRYAPDIIAKELNHARDPSGRNFLYDTAFREKYEENPDEAYKLAESYFNDSSLWAELYGGPGWAKYAKYNGLLNHELDIASKLGDRGRELIQEHGRLVWEGSKLQKDYYKSCVDVSRYVNFIDSLEHNTGSFFTKLVSRQTKAGLGPGTADGTGIDDYGQHTSYYSDLMKLTDAKELTNENDVLAIIAPFKHLLPSNIGAYLPADVSTSENVDDNLLNIRLGRVLGSDIKSVLNIIRSATRNDVREESAERYVYDLNQNSNPHILSSLYQIFSTLATITDQNLDLLYKTMDTINYSSMGSMGHISKESINKVKKMFEKEFVDKLNEWNIDLTKKKPAPPPPEEAKLRGLTFIATSLDGGFFVNDSMHKLYRVKLPHIYRVNLADRKTLIGPIDVGDSWDEMIKAELEIRKFTDREAKKLDTPDLKPKLPPASYEVCMLADGSGENKFYVYNYKNYPQVYLLTQDGNLSHFMVDLGKMSQRFMSMINSIKDKVSGKAASTNLFSKKTKRS